jgi:hypothetical protein
MRSDPSVVTAGVGLVLSLTLPVPAQAPDTASSHALRFYAGVPSGDPATVLRTLRPPAVSREERAKVVATLPENGELQPRDSELVKIRALDPILEYHERRNVLQVVVIDVPQVVVGFHGRSVLLLSRPALQILSAAELQAMVAHEIGHDYFWADMERLARQPDPKRRQILELKCDGVAGLTMVALGLRVAPLFDGIRRMGTFNERLGATAGAEGYPTLRERRAFLDALLGKTQR